jgi:hypothetical protein
MALGIPETLKRSPKQNLGEFLRGDTVDGDSGLGLL